MVAYRCFSFPRWYIHIIHYDIFGNTNVCIIAHPQKRLNIITRSRFCLCVVSSGKKMRFQLFTQLMIIFGKLIDEIIIFEVFIIFRNANICRIVYPQHSVGMLALSRFCLCAMSNGQHLFPIMVAYRSCSFSRWHTHMIHYVFFENPNFCIIVYPHNSLGI
jgi:hypothetical protein